VTKIVIGLKNGDTALLIDYTVRDNIISLTKDGIEETDLIGATNLWDMEHAKRILKTIQDNREKFYEPEWVDSLCVFEVEVEARKKKYE